MTVRAFDFADQLAMSQGTSTSASIRDILLGNIPGALSAHPSHGSNDRQGTDWWIEMYGGKHLSVDCKVRAEDWSRKNPPQDDLALETWSVIETKKIGWTRDADKRTDYILFFWQDTGRWVLIPFPMLCAVFVENWQKWMKTYKHRQQTTTGHGAMDYHSECVFVPRVEVWHTVYRKYGGQIKNQGDTQLCLFPEGLK